MNPDTVFQFTCPVKTNSGMKALEHLPAELASLDAARPVILTDAATTGAGAVRTLTNAFGDSGMTLGLFDDIPKAANLSLIEELKKACLEKRYDAIIALGGGTIVDVAKILNLAVSQKTADARQLTPATPVHNHLQPLVVVPTASANGLETSKYAHLDKCVYASEYLAPNLVVVDPRLTRAHDRKTIAATGLAALGRAVDAQIAADKNPFRDAYSFAAIRFIKENLVNAVKNPRDKKASLAVLNAAAMSGCAFSNTETAPLHKLGQVFYEMQHVHPGIIMGIALPYVLGDYLERGGYDFPALLHPLVWDDEFARTPDVKKPEAAMTILQNFLGELHAVLGKEMPRTLKEAGVPNYMMEDILEVLGKENDGAYLGALAQRIWDDKPVT